GLYRGQSASGADPDHRRRLFLWPRDRRPQCAVQRDLEAVKRRAAIRLSLGLAAVLALTGTGRGADPVELYTVSEGLNINSFTRAGPVAAHVVLRSGKQP